MNSNIAIFGCGGFGREVLQIVRDINAAEPGTWTSIAFLVDEGVTASEFVQGVPVFPYRSFLLRNPNVKLVVAIGSSAARYSIVQRIKEEFTVDFVTLVHPRAWLGENVQIGDGSVICAGALLTTDLLLRDHVHVNIGCTVGHDAVLENFVTLNPSVNVSGNCQLADGVEVGTGSILLPKVEIGHWSVIGAGSVVTKSLGKNITAVGAPAREIKSRPEAWYKSK